VIEHDIDILFIEDNPHDVELTLDALKLHNPSIRVHVLRDGEEALDYLFARGKKVVIPAQAGIQYYR